MLICRLLMVLITNAGALTRSASVVDRATGVAVPPQEKLLVLLSAGVGWRAHNRVLDRQRQLRTRVAQLSRDLASVVSAVQMCQRSLASIACEAEDLESCTTCSTLTQEYMGRYHIRMT